MINMQFYYMFMFYRQLKRADILSRAFDFSAFTDDATLNAPISFAKREPSTQDPKRTKTSPQWDKSNGHTPFPWLNA
jgi:hypothetical protein